MQNLAANKAISEMLDELSEYLLRKGENVHKVKAYRKAALLVKMLPYNLAHMEQLTSIKGIGPTLSYTIELMLATGTCPLLEGLRQEFGGEKSVDG